MVNYAYLVRTAKHILVKEMCLEHMETQLPTVSQTNEVVSYDKPANTFDELKAPVAPTSSDSISISYGKAKIELSENVFLRRCRREPDSGR